MSIMTKGVIGMPYTIAMNSEMSRRQFYSHAQVLLAENDRLAEEYDKAWRHDLNDKNNVQVLAAEVVRLNAEIDRLRTAEGDAMTYKAGMENVAQQREELKKSLDAIDKDLRGRVNDPDPLRPIFPGAASFTTTYGLVAGIRRERDKLKAEVARSTEREILQLAEIEALREFILGFAEYDAELAYAYAAMSKAEQ